MSQGAAAHPDFDHAIRSPLTAVGRALKRQVVLQGVCRCAVILVALALVQFALDVLLILGTGPRVALLLMVLGVAGHQLWWWVIRPAMLRVDPQQVAALVERRNPALHDRLVSAVAFSNVAAQPDRESAAMIEATIRESVQLMRTVRLNDLFLPRRHHQFLAAGLTAVGLCAALAFSFPDMAATYVARNLVLRDVPWPSGVSLVLEGFVNDRLRWPVGDDLTLVATAVDEVPPGVRVEFESPEGQRVVREMGRRGANQFVLDYGPLQASMRVRFTIWRVGADEHTRWYSIEAVERPAISDLAIRITPPGYSGLETYALASGQTATDLLRGSRVDVVARTNKPVVRAALRSSDRVIGETTVESERDISANFEPTQSGAYYFDLLDADGLNDNRPVTISLRIVSDPPPKAKLVLAGVGEMVVPVAVLPLEISCEDNLGLSSVELAHSINRSEETTTQPAPKSETLPRFTVGQTRYDLKEPWPLLPLTVQPGDQITLQVRATDHQPPTVATTSTAPTTPENLGVSGAYTLRVVTAEELSAELARRENEWRREFEQVIKSQEQLEARLKELLAVDAADRASNTTASRLNAERRTQRQQASRLRTIGRQFEQILAEMEVNQLASGTVRRRLDSGVIGPMRRLATEEIPAAADRIDALRDGFDDAKSQAVLDSQTQLVRQMYAILANMLKWEGYDEAVSLLRDIIRLQGDLNEDTQKKLQEEVESLFRDDAGDDEDK